MFFLLKTDLISITTLRMSNGFSKSKFSSESILTFIYLLKQTSEILLLTK